MEGGIKKSDGPDDDASCFNDFIVHTTRKETTSWLPERVG